MNKERAGLTDERETPRVPMPKALYIVFPKIAGAIEPGTVMLAAEIGVLSKTHPRQKEQKPFVWVGNVVYGLSEESDRRNAAEFLTKITVSFRVRCVLGPAIDFGKSSFHTKHVQVSDRQGVVGLYVDPNKYTKSFIADHVEDWPNAESLRSSSSKVQRSKFNDTFKKILAALPTV